MKEKKLDVDIYDKYWLALKHFEVEAGTGEFILRVDGEESYILLDDDGGMELASAVLFGDEAGVEIGCSLANAGDVNGDEYDDVLIGTCDDGSTTGYAALLYGQQENLSRKHLVHPIFPFVLVLF